MGQGVTIMAGGTGGHVFPALAVAAELRTRGWQIHWLGTPHSFESRILPAHGITLTELPVRPLRGKGVLARLRAPLNLAQAVWRAVQALRRQRPQVVLGMGGFAAAPGGIAARLLGIPLVIHEQNTVPGLTNRGLARLAQRVLEAFPRSFPPARHAVLVGNPVRESIVALPPPAQRWAGRDDAVRLLVIGGSQGAQALNQQLPAALARLPLQRRPQIIHQAGRGKLAALQQAYAEAGVDATAQEFIDDMAAAYAWADLVVCRAGALTVSELAVAGLGAVLVPYPHAMDDHQTRNARYLADAGAAEVLAQAALDPAQGAAVLETLLDRARLLRMAEAAQRLALPDATRQVADICVEVAA